jgi:hypothetical protein
MTTEDVLFLKRILLWCLVILCGILTAYVLIFSLSSIWIGLNHSHQPGFWLPIIAGILSFLLVGWLFLALIKKARAKMKPEDVLEH